MIYTEHMNSHFEEATDILDELFDISDATDKDITKEDYRLFRLSYEHAHTQATLSLTFEQHTANLISFLPLLPTATRSQKKVMLDLGHTIAERLGITLAVDADREAEFLADVR